jgi:alanine racemase
MASVNDPSELAPGLDDSDGDEPRVLRPRRAAPADAVRPTRAEINLAHLRHNLRALGRALGRSTLRAQREGEQEKPETSGPRVWAVLKADAYGHGAPAVARTLERAGVDGLCVALLEEAIELRSAGIRIPILVMGGYYGPQHRGLEEAIESELVPVLYHPEQIERLAKIAELRGAGPASFHLKIDTGMARLGVRPEGLEPLLDTVRSRSWVRLDGVMSHLACADLEDRRPTLEQLARFEAARQQLTRARLEPALAHIANSAGALAFPAARLDAVRPGIAIYGVSPFARGLVDPSTAETIGEPAAVVPAGRTEHGTELRPVMRVRTEIVALRTLEDGDRVGYGHTYVARGRRTIATLPMGYADGLSRALSNRGQLLVRGRRAPIAGIVSMDLTALDVTDIDGVALGDEVVVLGHQEGPLGSDSIHATEIAERTSSIPWEVLTSISRRVPRFYREP